METDIKDKIRIIRCNKDDIELLIKYKLETIMEFATDIDKKEYSRMKKYAIDAINKIYFKYNKLELDGKIVGIYLDYDYDDGRLIDEIYIEEEYRGMGIGSYILQSILDRTDIAYLWVYKRNERAIKLYKKLHFVVDRETETRYFMKYEKGNN